MNALRDRYRDHARRQCQGHLQIENPEMCPAGRNYVAYVNRFADDTIRDSVKNTAKTERDLYQARLKNKDHLRIYPIVNHDFNYQIYAKRNYNAYQLGITNEPSMSNFNDASTRLGKYGMGLSSDPFPADGTVAGHHDIIPEDTELVKIKQSYKQLNETLPYPSFRKDFPEQYFPTTGRHASSYFLRTGTCPTSIKDEAECLKRGYEWTPHKPPSPSVTTFFSTAPAKPEAEGGDPNAKTPPKEPTGTCAKPRFNYVDNSSRGSYGSTGLVPSLMNDIMSLSPTSLMGVLAGYTVEGSGVLPCIDEFIDYGTDDGISGNQTETIHSYIVVGLLMALVAGMVMLRRR